MAASKYNSFLGLNRFGAILTYHSVPPFLSLCAAQIFDFGSGKYKQDDLGSHESTAQYLWVNISFDAFCCSLCTKGPNTENVVLTQHGNGKSLMLHINQRGTYKSVVAHNVLLDMEGVWAHWKVGMYSKRTCGCSRFNASLI